MAGRQSWADLRQAQGPASPWLLGGPEDTHGLKGLGQVHWALTATIPPSWGLSHEQVDRPCSLDRAVAGDRPARQARQGRAVHAAWAAPSSSALKCPTTGSPNLVRLALPARGSHPTPVLAILLVALSRIGVAPNRTGGRSGAAVPLQEGVEAVRAARIICSHAHGCEGWCGRTSHHRR